MALSFLKPEITIKISALKQQLHQAFVKQIEITPEQIRQINISTLLF